MAMQAGQTQVSDDDNELDGPLLADINVTPLVDVMLVLLIIFMVTAPLMMAGVPLHLPRTNATRQTPSPHPVVLSLDAGGHVYLGDETIDDADVPQRLRTLAVQIDQQPVYLRADQALPYGQVMHLLGEMTSAGVAHISLLSVHEQAQGAAEK
jgi:biopolymer transport protein ExbD